MKVLESELKDIVDAIFVNDNDIFKLLSKRAIDFSVHFNDFENLYLQLQPEAVYKFPVSSAVTSWLEIYKENFIKTLAIKHELKNYLNYLIYFLKFHFWDTQAFIDIVSNIKSKKINMIELGSGVGSLLLFAQQYFYFKKIEFSVYGTEIIQITKEIDFYNPDEKYLKPYTLLEANCKNTHPNVYTYPYHPKLEDDSAWADEFLKFPKFDMVWSARSYLFLYESEFYRQLINDRLKENGQILLDLCKDSSNPHVKAFNFNDLQKKGIHILGKKRNNIRVNLSKQQFLELFD